MTKFRQVPQALIEQLHLGELSPLEAEDVRQRLQAEPGGLARLDDLAASNEDILSRYPPPQMAMVLRRPMEPNRMAWLRPALVLAPVLLIALTWALLPAPPSQDTTRVKGHAMLLIHRQGPQGAEELARGAAAQPGDLLQLSYVASTAPHGIILSLDGRGQVTLHLPPSPQGPTAMASKGTLPYAYELDDAPAFERFILVTSDQPIDVQAVLDAARSLGPDPARPLPLPLEQHDFLVRKVPRRE